MNLKRLFLYLLIASIAVSALVGVGVIIFGEFGDLETKVLLTSLTVTVTSILGLACGAFFESGRGRVMPIAGIVLAIVSAVMWIIVIWTWREQNDSFVKTLMSVTALASACSLLSLISLARLDRRFRWSRYAAHVAAWLLTAIALYLIWRTPDPFPEWLARLIGTLAVVLAALTVITPVFHFLSSSTENVEMIDVEIAKLQARIEELESRKAGLAHGPSE